MRLCFLRLSWEVWHARDCTYLYIWIHIYIFIILCGQKIKVISVVLLRYTLFVYAWLRGSMRGALCSNKKWTMPHRCYHVNYIWYHIIKEILTCSWKTNKLLLHLVFIILFHLCYVFTITTITKYINACYKYRQTSQPSIKSPRPVYGSQFV